MKKEKLKLTELRAKSFVTMAREKVIRGGAEITAGLDCESSHRNYQCFCRPW